MGIDRMGEIDRHNAADSVANSIKALSGEIEILEDARIDTRETWQELATTIGEKDTASLFASLRREDDVLS